MSGNFKAAIFDGNASDFVDEITAAGTRRGLSFMVMLAVFGVVTGEQCRLHDQIGEGKVDETDVQVIIDIFAKNLRETLALPSTNDTIQ